METNWIIIVVVLVVLILLVIYLITKNMKDKDDVVGSLNETEVDDEDDSKREIRKDDL